MLAGLSQFTELPAVYTYYINTSMQNPNVFGLFLYIGHSNRFTAFLIWNRAGKEEEWGKKNKLVCKTALPWSNRQTSHLAQHWHKTAQLTVWGDLNTEFQVSASISPTRSFPCPWDADLPQCSQWTSCDELYYCSSLTLDELSHSMLVFVFPHLVFKHTM